MSYFNDAEEVYGTLGKLFRELAVDDQLAPRLAGADTIVQFVYRQPECQITAVLRPGQPGRVEFGPTELDPEVTMTSEADVAHRFWLGRVNLTLAMARGEIEAAGPIAKLLALAPLAEDVFPRYRALLRSQARDHMIEL